MHGIVVKEERHLPKTSAEPSNKVDSYPQAADAFVALCTPDDELADGTFRVRPNIISEIERARARPKLLHRILVLKAPEVELEASNLNPVHDDLDLGDPQGATELILDRLRVWEVLPAEPKPSATAGEPARTVTDLIDGLELGDHDEATRRACQLLLSVNRQGQSGTVEELRDFLLSASSEDGDVVHRASLHNRLNPSGMACGSDHNRPSQREQQCALTHLCRGNFLVGTRPLPRDHGIGFSP